MTATNYSNGVSCSQWIKPFTKKVFVSSENHQQQLLDAVILLAHQLDFRLTEKHKQTSAFQRLRQLEQQIVLAKKRQATKLLEVV